MAQNLAEAVGEDAIKTTMLPLILKMADDKVPNIRFNVGKCLEKMVPFLDKETYEERIKPTLEKMAKDADHDVSYHAIQAMEKAKD